MPVDKALCKMLIHTHEGEDVQGGNIGSVIPVKTINETNINATSSATYVQKVYLLGDSLTGGSTGGKYETYLIPLLGSNFITLNYGVGGETSTQIKARVYTDVINKGDAAYCILMAGLNNAAQVATVEADLQEMFTALRRAGIKVVALKLTPRDGLQTYISQINNWLETQAYDYDYLVDVFTPLDDPSNPGALNPIYAYDVVHPNAAGCELMANTIYPAVSWEMNYSILIAGPSAINQALLTTSTPTFAGMNVNGDVDFNGYKAIAMACDNGTTFPGSPTKGQWFLHTPTGRSWLYQYSGTAWIPIFAFGTSTIFFDPTGTDSQDKGWGTGSDAYATPNYAYSQIPALFSGAITIYGAAGTYNQAVALGGKTATGAFAINFVGTTTTLDSGTMTSSVQGTGATRGSITDTTKAWTVDQFKGKFVKVGTTYRVIFSNDATTLTIQGTFPSLPSGAYSIEEVATNLSRTTGSSFTFITGTYNHNFSLCKISSAGASNIVFSGSLGQMSFTNCHLSMDGVGTTFYQGSYFIPTFSYCYFSVTNTSAYVCNAIANCAFTFYGNYVRSTSGTKANNGMVFGAGCYLVAAIGNTWDNFSNAIQLTGVGSATFATAASNGYNFLINNANGINVITGAAISSITNNQYSGNTTNIAHAWTPGETVFQALRNSVAPLISRQASGGTVALIQAQNSSSQTLMQVDTNGGAVFNEQGRGDADVRIEGDTDVNLLVTDASADAVGIGTNLPTSGLDIQKSLGYKISTISTNTTLGTSNLCVLASGNITITLPTAVGNSRVYIIKKTDATTILTINTTSSQTIDGNTSVQLTTRYTSLTLVSNGANWNIV